MPSKGDGQSKSQAANTTVLIVGDWVVDEYWFLARHHSQISSHTGFVHFRVLSDQGEPMVDLCGAGHVARILLMLREKNKPTASVEIVGLGHWNARDTVLIHHLLHACSAGTARFGLTWQPCEDPPNIRLETLAPGSPTTQVVRLYERSRLGIEQINRIDWETPETCVSELTLDQLDVPEEGSSPMIVINDLRKGVVTQDLISQLSGRFPNSRWCIRSKDREPRWLNPIEDRVDLLVVGPEVTAHLNPWGSWLAREDAVSYEAIDTLDSLPGRNVVLIAEGQEVVARLGKHSDSDAACVMASLDGRVEPTVELGWPTAVFAGLVHRILTNHPSDLELVDVEEAVDVALKSAGVHMPKAFGRPKVSMALSNSELWSDELGKWEQARKDLGVVVDDGESVLDVWRGMSFAPNYIACVEQKKAVLGRIGRALRSFHLDRDRPSPLSILLQADPGAGKTVLVEALAKAFDFSLLPFDITQMLERRDLLALFDKVATRQANDSRDLLVFVDEINATLGRSHVYGAFLSPLEAGFYVRAGLSFSLRPCVWLFAGTNLDESLPKGEKLSDFRSRITLEERIDYASLLATTHDADEKGEVRRQAKLEQVYLGMLMIHRFFPDVTEISEAVLNCFYLVEPADQPARRIRRWCAALRNVQYGRVTLRNCPDWDLEIPPLKELLDHKMIKVRF
jgi:hypothetical protein